MVEVKIGDKWPREQKEVERDWKEFEVGDKLDVFDNNEWKVGRIVRVIQDKLKIHIVNQHWKNDLLISKESSKL